MKITAEFDSYEEMTAWCETVAGKAVEAPKPAKPRAKKTEEAAPAPVPVPDPVQPQAAAPVPAPAPVAKKVTLQEVTAKAIPLIDAGRQGDLQALLAKYGVPALPSLPEERLGEFLKDLEGLG